MAQRLPTIALALAGLVLAALTGPAEAKFDKPVDLELILGVDVSRSIDKGEAQLQRDGYIAAFSDPDVIRAISSGMFGRIAVAYFEWAGQVHREIIVDWILIDGKKSAVAFAAELGRQGYRYLWVTADYPEGEEMRGLANAATGLQPAFESDLVSVYRVTASVAPLLEAVAADGVTAPVAMSLTA